LLQASLVVDVRCPLREHLLRFLAGVYSFYDTRDLLVISVLTGFMPSFEWLPLRLPKYSSIILSLKTSSVDSINVLNTMFTGEVYFNVYALRPVDAQPVLEGYLDKRGKTGFQNSHFEAIRKASLESAGLEGVPLNCSPLFLNLCINLSDNWVSFDPAPVLPDNIPDLVKVSLVCCINVVGTV
jgi:hypothetical protein